MKKNQILQFLRACGALSVFLTHFLGAYNIAGNKLGGQLGVAIFFVISGYLLVEKTDYTMLNGYFVKKIVRIFPLYWICTCVLVIIGIKRPSLLHTSVITLKTVIKSFFLIPNAVPKTNYIQPLLPVGWTLYLEVYVYILFYMCICICKNAEKAGILTTFFLVMLNILRNVTDSENVYMNTYGGMVVLYFGIGMITSILVKKEYIRTKRKLTAIEAILFVSLFIVAEQFYGQVSYGKIILVGVSFMGILFFMKDWSVPKFFIKYGDISYSFYLLHYFVIKFFARIIFPNNKNLIVCLCMAVITFLSTCALSVLSYELIEQRFGSFLKRKLL